MYFVNPKSSSPVRTKGKGTLRLGEDCCGGICSGLVGSSSASFKLHLGHACPSGFLPLVPMSA